MDIIFECPNCKQELSIDEAGAGTEIECPACNRKVVVPEADAQPPTPAPAASIAPPPASQLPRAPGGGPAAESHVTMPTGDNPVRGIINAMASSAAAKESKHFVVPVHEGPTEVLIAKPLPTLEVAAKESDRQMRVKSFRHSDHVEVGKDHFDEHINQWLGKVGEPNIISISPFTYTHQDLASRAWVTDYGLLIVYRG